MSVQELYETSVRPLTAAQRLELATLILQGIPASAMVDESDEWTEEDLDDFARAGWKVIEQRLGDESNA